MDRQEGFKGMTGADVVLRLFALFTLLILCPLSTWAQPALTGYVEPYAAVRALDDGAFLAGRTRARLDLTGSFEGGAYTIQNEATYDLLGDSLRHDLREAYIDAFFAKVDVRAGRQIIAWGTTDGAFITDVLAPLDLSEFLTQPQDRLRLGVTAARATAYLGTLTADAVWIPVSPTSDLPAQDGPWNPAPTDVLRVPIVRTEANRPGKSLSTSEVAARISWSGLPQTDLSLVVHNGTNRVPGFEKRLALEHFRGPRIELIPTYRRRTILGLTAETASFEPFVLRGEAAYESRALLDERLPEIRSLDDLRTLVAGIERGFLVERPQVQAALTAERVYGSNLVRLTGLGRWVLDHDETVAVDSFQPAVTALWNGTFRRETVTARVFAFWNVGADLWLNPSLTYALRDALNLEVGAQIFEALDTSAPDGLFGDLVQDPSRAFALYDGNDLVYARLRYSF